MKEKLDLTRRQWTFVVVVGVGSALLRTPTLPSAFGYALLSLPGTYLVVLVAARLLGFVGLTREKAT